MSNGTGFTDFLANSDWGSLLLSQMPGATYYSDPGGQEFAAQSPRQGRYFQQAYQDVYNQYLGNIGTSLREGREPTTFRQFIESEDPWTARYGKLPQFERGVTKTYTDPRTRFIFY
jgi:hypothetical protein